MPEAPVGILACDEEAYRSFNDLFGPIIKDLHRDFDFRYSYKFDEMSTAGLTDELASLNKL